MLTARVMDSELKHGVNDEASSKVVHQSYEQAIPADSVARAIAFAIEHRPMWASTRSCCAL